MPSIPAFQVVAPEYGERLTYELAYWWEEWLPVVSFHGKLTWAVTAGGAALAAEPVCLVARPGRQPGAIHAFFGYPPKGVRDLAPEITLEGEVTLKFAVGQQEIRINNALVSKAKGITVDGVSLQIKSVDREGRMVVLTLLPAATDRGKSVSDYSGHAHYGFILIDAGGRRHAAAVARRRGGDGGGTYFGFRIRARQEETGPWFTSLHEPRVPHPLHR